MRVIKRRLLTSMLVVVLLCVAGLPAQAQTALTEDQVAALGRALNAELAVYRYGSFLADRYREEQQSLAVITAEGVVEQESDESTTSESLMAIIRGTTPNGFFAEIRTVEEDGNAYTIQGEMRYVDGTLYASGQYLDGVAPYTFAQGFMVIQDPALAADLDIFEPQKFLDLLNGVQAESPLNDPVMLQNLVSNVTVEQGNVNGIPVEVITATIDNTGLAAFMQASGDADNQTLQLLLQYASPESNVTLKMSVDQQGNAVQSEVSTQIIIADVALSLLDPNAAPGTVVNVNVSRLERTTYSQINAVTEMVGAPA